MQKKAIVLLSGGIDSATCCALAKKQGFEIYCLSFTYGQKHEIELKSACTIANVLGATKHLVIPIDLTIFEGSSLTQKDLSVPKNRIFSANKDTEIPNTYVPARNTLFLSYALAWAEVILSHDIFIGVNAVDYSGYPDCRPEFIRAFEAMAQLATKIGIQSGKIAIHTPLINLKKSEIIALGFGLGIDFGLSHSCYDPFPDGSACGSCDSCIIRKQGFAEANIPDPTRYHTEK